MYVTVKSQQALLHNVLGMLVQFSGSCATELVCFTELMLTRLGMREAPNTCGRLVSLLTFLGRCVWAGCGSCCSVRRVMGAGIWSCLKNSACCDLHVPCLTCLALVVSAGGASGVHGPLVRPPALHHTRPPLLNDIDGNDKFLPHC